jgi:hypothetical protein
MHVVVVFCQSVLLFYDVHTNGRPGPTYVRLYSSAYMWMRACVYVCFAYMWRSTKWRCCTIRNAWHWSKPTEVCSSYTTTCWMQRVWHAYKLRKRTGLVKERKYQISNMTECWMWRICYTACMLCSSAMRMLCWMLCWVDMGQGYRSPMACWLPCVQTLCCIRRSICG